MIHRRSRWSTGAHRWRLTSVDRCVLPERSPDGWLTCSMGACGGVLCARGWHPEQARSHVVRLSVDLRAGRPDFSG